MRTLGEPRRSEIVRLIWSRELPATEIAEHFPDVTRSAISQHLRVMREAGIVRDRRDGTRRLYSVDQSQVARVRAFLDSFWTNNLETLRELAEADHALKGT